MQRRRSRVQRSTLAASAAVAAGTAGYVLGSAVAGSGIGESALLVALAASWLCVLLLALLSAAGDGTTLTPLSAAPTALADRGRGDTVGVAEGTPTARASLLIPATRGRGTGRDRDPVSGLLHYDLVRDDRYVARTSERPGAVIVVEIVDHVTASAMAASIADRLVAAAAGRVSATAATYGAVVRRLYGPQLALLLPTLDGPALAELARALHDGAGLGVTPAALLEDPTRPPRLVAGVAVASDLDVEVTTLIRWATTAAAQAKRQGAEAPVFFHHRIADEARERLAVGRALRAAIDDRTIGLVYQPQIDLVDGSFLGVEALARWRDPQLGAIAPDRFLQVAADIGMSWQLDRLIFEQAFAQLSDWDAAGIPVPRLCLNVSPETVAEGRRIGLRHLMAAYNIDPGRVTVELAHDDIAGNDADTAAAAVRRCREMGVRVTLDHVGRGSASFDQLSELPVTGLKIDRSLLGEDADTASLSAVIQSGTSLGLSVVAVGIETVEQRDLLRRLGCVVGQGYLYAPPLTPTELADWLGVARLVAEGA